MKILGIDEAGRGPVLGPLVVCGYLVDSSRSGELKASGVKDSKQLTPGQRQVLAPSLRRLCDSFFFEVIEPDEIDSRNLNHLEISAMQRIIKAASPDKVIIDSPERNITAFGKKVQHGLGVSPEIVCRNFADSLFPEVSAASVLAKLERDSRIARLHKVYGDFGSGYTHDPATIGFLKDWIKSNKVLPPIVRKKWSTVSLLVAEKEQKTLGSWSEES